MSSQCQEPDSPKNKDNKKANKNDKKKINGHETEGLTDGTGTKDDNEEFHIKRKSPTEKARLSGERRKQIDIYKESVTREERELRYKRRLNGDPVSSPVKGSSSSENSPRRIKRVAFKCEVTESIRK